MKKKEDSQKLAFRKSKNGNYEVDDSIGVPHPYCITAGHVTWAADHWGERLGPEAIKDAEANHKAICGTCSKAQNEYPVLSFNGPLEGLHNTTHHVIIEDRKEN